MPQNLDNEEKGQTIENVNEVLIDRDITGNEIKTNQNTLNRLI